MAKRRQYRFTGHAYMRPLGRGINVQGTFNQEPYVALEEEIGKALGVVSGDFYIEVVARPRPPRKFKEPRRKTIDRSKPCLGCGGRMHPFSSTDGEGFECRACGHRQDVNYGHPEE